MLGAVGRGFVDTLRVLDAGRIGIAALSVGLAQGAFEAALAYAKARRQFGRPIAAFQAIRWKLADMATRIEAARLLTYRAAWLRDRREERTSTASSVAKLYASEVAVRAAEECVQIHGGYGFVKDYPAEKYLPRREALHDWRRHERDSAARNCPAASGPVTVSASLVTGVLEREPRAVARALSAVSDDPVAGPALLAAIRDRTGRALLVGVTGPPGAGKSTLVDRLIRGASRYGAHCRCAGGRSHEPVHRRRVAR